MIHQEDIAKALRLLDIPRGCVLMTHSSMRAFGKPLDGGAEMLVDALLDHIGKSGTLVMPTLSFSSVDEQNPVFDAVNTPSSCGILTEVMRKRPHAHRSLHVVSSACAIGKKAEWITKAHDDTPCGKDSPYEKVISEDGYVLFIGAGFGSNTLFHVAEETVTPSYLCYAEIANARIITANGAEYRHTYRRYDCSQRGIHRNLAKMEPIFEQRDVLRHARIGTCELTLISAKKNHDISCEVLRENPEYILDQY